MSEYIKREDAKHLFLNHLGNHFPLSFKEQIVEKAFEELPPSADVVEVVRCKDCDFWNKDENISGGICDEWSDFEDSIISYTKPDDYCSRGERKENE